MIYRVGITDYTFSEVIELLVLDVNHTKALMELSVGQILYLGDTIAITRVSSVFCRICLTLPNS
jgi:hypothetical protein